VHNQNVPKRVDPVTRRAELVDAYLRIVSRSSVAAATSRALAVEAGIASGALWHYFPDFDSVVSAAFQRVYGQTNERIRVATTGRRGLDALDAMSVDILPHDSGTRDESVVVVSFWGLLPTHAEFREHARAVERDWGCQVTQRLREAIQDGDLAPHTPVAPLTDALLAVFEVLQLREVQQSDSAAPERQRALLNHLLVPWRAAAVPGSH